MRANLTKALFFAYLSFILVADAQTQQPVDYSYTSPRITEQQGMEIQKTVSDYILQSKRVDVSGYVREGSIVRPYSRQPAGGITPADKLEADLWGIAAVALVGVIDYGLQKWEKRKSGATFETLRQESVIRIPDKVATTPLPQEQKKDVKVATSGTNLSPDLKFVFVDDYITHLQNTEPRFAQLVDESIKRNRSAGTAYGFKGLKFGRAGIVSRIYLIENNQGIAVIAEIVEKSDNPNIFVGDLIIACNEQKLAPNAVLRRLIYNSPNPVGTHSLRVIRGGTIKDIRFATIEFLPSVSETLELQNDEACYEVALSSLINSLKK